jgi:hypothetical protein
MGHRYRVEEFVLKTDHTPELGIVYYLGPDGNMYETTIGPKGPGYKPSIAAKLSIKREKGWLYFIKRNPPIKYSGRHNAKVPDGCVCEVWRQLISSAYGVADMSKKEILDEILEDWEDLSTYSDDDINEDRGAFIRWIRKEDEEIEMPDDPDDIAGQDLHTIAFQLEQIRRFGKIVYRSEKNGKNKR